MNAKPDRKSSVVPDGIRSLLEKRATYQEWLGRLGEVGAQYRSEVAERVRNDYEARLADVARDLEGHRSELESSLDERRGRLNELATEFERRSAELEEAELRFQVGEYDEKTWDERRTEHTENLEGIETGLGEARDAVDELERALGEITPGDAATAGGAPGAIASDGSAANGVHGVHAVPAAGDDPLPGPGIAASLSSTPAADMADWQRQDALAGGSGVKSEDPNLEASKPKVSSEVAEKLTEDDTAERRKEPGADRRPKPASEPVTAAGEPAAGADEESDDYRDELAFLESLSLDDTESFDAVSRLLEDEEDR
ncbi:MAG: hypothetical protein ACR2GQ_05855 [Gemmatimonadota bacterium]